MRKILYVLLAIQCASLFCEEDLNSVIAEIKKAKCRVVVQFDVYTSNMKDALIEKTKEEPKNDKKEKVDVRMLFLRSDDTDSIVAWGMMKEGVKVFSSVVIGGCKPDPLMIMAKKNDLYVTKSEIFFRKDRPDQTIGEREFVKDRRVPFNGQEFALVDDTLYLFPNFFEDKDLSVKRIKDKDEIKKYELWVFLTSLAQANRQGMFPRGPLDIRTGQSEKAPVVCPKLVWRSDTEVVHRLGCEEVAFNIYRYGTLWLDTTEEAEKLELKFCEKCKDWETAEKQVVEPDGTVLPIVSYSLEPAGDATNLYRKLKVQLKDGNSRTYWRHEVKIKRSN